MAKVEGSSPSVPIEVDQPRHFLDFEVAGVSPATIQIKRTSGLVRALYLIIISGLGKF